MDSAKKLTISGQDGSSLFYSVDGGITWKLYSKEVTLEQTPEKILCFSIYRGVKSEVKEISTEPLTGSLIGDGSIWFLIVGAAFVVGMGVVGIGISRKKKKEEAENN
jgi:LPXTG-motif cell wall-anchored protein